MSRTEKKQTMKTLDEIYNNLIDDGFFTEEELELLTNINGYNIDTLNDAIYSRYGYRDYEQLTDAE